MRPTPQPHEKILEPAVYSRDEHNISRQSIDPDALKIMYRLLRHGYKAFLVGGGVRDLLLGKIPKDFDIGTDATPRKVKALFRNSRIIGRRFKLVHVFFRGNRNIEVSTFRDLSEPNDDIEEQGDAAQQIHDNVYGDESTDAIRRDITINGLFYDLATFSVIDYVGGMQDLREGIIRVIGDPDVRFAEDPVRLLRVIRHSARTGFVIEPACWQSLLRNNHLISQSPLMRVYEEVKKDLRCGYFLPILRLLHEGGLLKQLIPTLDSQCDSILSPEHPLTRALTEVDRMARSGEDFSPTVVLALLVFLSAPMYSEGRIHMDGQTDLFQAINETFSVLQVPRKEKERIEQLLDAYYFIDSTPREKLRINMLSKKPYFEDLAYLTKILVACGWDESLLEIVTEAQSSKVNEQRSFESGQHQQRRRRRGGRGRGRGGQGHRQ